MITAFDDYPVHQIAEPIRHVGTSDRNFYDRYYFNCHAGDKELFLVMGFGQYPNLGVHDAFAVVSRGDLHRVVRASAELADRGAATIGPLRVEVVTPLEELRVICDENEHGLAFDLTWTGSIQPFEEPRHHIRKHGRVLFDTCRFAQTGRWEGTIEIAGSADAGADDVIQVTPDRWLGSRDRSWGVRPVGEQEPPGIRGAEGQMSGMWNYFPIQFDDYALLYMINETDTGERTIEEAMRVAPDGQAEWLGRPEHDHVVSSGTRLIEEAVVRFPDAPGGPLELTGHPMARCFLGVGTGYGLDDDWRHGMHQGPLVVQGRDFSNDEIGDIGQFVIVENGSRFELSDGSQTDVGYGMIEHGFWGQYERYGMEGAGGVAP